MEELKIIVDQRWMVAKTKTRCEKKFAKYCNIKEIIHYLPLRKSIRKYKRSKAEFYIPLFPGYVFVQTEPMNKALLLESNQLVSIIIPDQSYEVQFVKELNIVRNLLLATSQGEIVMRPEIVIGDVVRIKSGPLEGVSGIVEKRKNKIKISVNIEFIGHSASLEVDVTDVEIDI